MNTYLLTWNPNKWDWSNYNDCKNELDEKGYFESRWSCGVTKRIEIGDQLYLMKLGEEPKGIVASGIVIRESFVSKHYNDNQKEARYIHARFDVLLDYNESIFGISKLKELDSTFQWTPQASGISINSDLSLKLNVEFEKHINYLKIERQITYVDSNDINNKFLDEVNKEIISDETPIGIIKPSQKTATTRIFQRSVKVSAFVLNRAEGKCEDCKQLAPFISKNSGKPYLEVHHIISLSLGGSDTIDNTVALCPNCHRKRHYG